MTKIKNNTAKVNIQMNIEGIKRINVPSAVLLDLDKTFQFLQDNLPRYYAAEAKRLLPKNKKVDIAYIRRVKNQKISNPHIITALYRIAQFHALQKKNII